MFRKLHLTAFATAVMTTLAVSSFATEAAADSRTKPVFGAATIAVQTRMVKTSPEKPGVSFLIARDMASKLNTMQWTFVAGTKGRPILSGNQYRLVNFVTQAGMKRQPRSLAANLGWLSPNSNDFNMRVRRLDGNGQLRYGDVVALELKSYGWLRHKKQSHGINIGDDDNKPHYIWRISGGKTGTKVASGMPFAVYNTQVKAELTHCTRTWGIDLGWHRKSDCGGAFASASGTIFGQNGLLASDGLTGVAAKNAKERLCEVGVGAVVAAIAGETGGLAGAAALAAAPKAISECKRL